MNIRKKVLLLALALLLCSCGTSPASKYYLLSAETSGLPSGNTPSLGVGPVEIPEYLNRHSFVYNREGNRLHVAKFERWAEPLDSSIARVIRLNLASLLNTQNAQVYPWSKVEAPEYAVKITVINLDTNGDQARLIAEWDIRKPRDNKLILRRISELNYTLAGGEVSAEDVAPAYSDLLAELSKIIAEAITADLAAPEESTEAPDNAALRSS